ncbi:MAG: hypothetical protein LQ348_004730, partial [Seirophora lacunosa]
ASTVSQSAARLSLEGRDQTLKLQEPEVYRWSTRRATRMVRPKLPGLHPTIIQAAGDASTKG